MPSCILPRQKGEFEVCEGQFSPPDVYDDHVLHIHRHNNFRLTTDYEELRAQNPLLDMIFQQHVMLHLAYIMPQQPGIQPGTIPGQTVPQEEEAPAV